MNVTSKIEVAINGMSPVYVGDTRIHWVPVYVLIREPLTDEEFKGFVDGIFEAEDNRSLPLWGNPIWLGKGKCHVYGLNLLQWLGLSMEFKRDLILFVFKDYSTEHIAELLDYVALKLPRIIHRSIEIFIGNTLIAVSGVQPKP